MSHVLFLAFGPHSGGLLVDEEYLDDKRRRKGFRQAAHRLLPDSLARRWELLALYAGTGSPSFNREILDGSRREFEALDGAEPRGRLDAAGVAERVGEVMRQALRRDMDRKLELWYGCTADDVNRNAFCRDGKLLPLKQPAVLERARSLMEGSYGDTKTGLRQGLRACILGWDRQGGLRAWHLDASNGNLAFTMDGYEAFGDGVYALGQGLSSLLNPMTARQRREGFSRAEGLYELLDVDLLARETHHTSRGCPHVILLDGEEEPGSRMVELMDEEARVALALVRARRAGMVDRSRVLVLLEALLAGEDCHEVEERLFQVVEDPRGLDLALRGYKLREIPRLLGREEGRRS